MVVESLCLLILGLEEAVVAANFYEFVADVDVTIIFPVN